MFEEFFNKFKVTNKYEIFEISFLHAVEIAYRLYNRIHFLEVSSW